MAKRVRSQHPGTEVFQVDMYNALESFVSLVDQVEKFKVIVDSYNITGKFNAVTHSQGGVIVRAYIEMYGDHRVHNWVSLSAPLMGVYGDTEFLQWLAPGVLYTEASKIAYTESVQNKVSIAQFWKDCSHRFYPKYLEVAKFLTTLNNEIKHDRSAEYRDNFSQLDLMVCVGGPNDGVIVPYQSAFWGYYAPNNNVSVLPMDQLDLYKSDAFGLKTLNEKGALKFFDIPHIFHTKWNENPDVIDNYVIPYLD
jgi:palmitoyl-protein thioesterase